jgi:hypothetical protein
MTYGDIALLGATAYESSWGKLHPNHLNAFFLSFMGNFMISYNKI